MGLRHQALQTAGLDNFHSVTSSNFAQDPMNMVFDCLFRKKKLGCNFFVGQPEAEHLQQLLFAPRQSKISPDLHIRNLCPLACYVLEQSHAEGWRADRFSMGNAADGSHDLESRGFLKNVTRNPLADGAQERFFVFFHANHYNLQFRHGPAYLGDKVQIESGTGCGIRHEDLGAGQGNLLQRLTRQAGRADDSDVVSFSEHPRERFAENAVFGKQEYVSHCVPTRIS